MVKMSISPRIWATYVHTRYRQACKFFRKFLDYFQAYRFRAESLLCLYYSLYDKYILLTVEI